jgi:hypothetical protein
MSIDAQASLFGEGRMTPPSRDASPDADAIRHRLNRLLDTLHNAATMPLSDRDARMWRSVVPNMTRWLPESEGERIRTTFAREMERLAAARPSEKD